MKNCIAPPSVDTRILFKRLEALNSSIETARRRLRIHDTVLQSARASLAGLAKPAKTPLPAVVRLRPDVLFYPDAPPAPWLKLTSLLPYAALAAFGLGLGLRGPWRQAPARSYAPTNQAPSFVAEAAPTQSLISEEAASDEALRLVYAYQPQGSRKTVRDILSDEIEQTAASQSSPWIVERGDDGRYIVSFSPYADASDAAPVYEFEVDLNAKTVTARPETEASLRGGDLADRR